MSTPTPAAESPCTNLKGVRMNHNLVRRYISDRVRRGELAATSAYQIRYVLGQWAAHVDSLPPRKWTADLAEAWVNADGLRATTRKSRLGKLRPFIHWLQRHDLIRRDPTRDIGRIRTPKGAPRNLEPDAVRRLLAVCPDQRAVLIVILMVQLALRCGDVARIRVEDIDVRHRRLHVRAKGGRGEPTHFVPITEEAWRYLLPWITCRTAGPLIGSYKTGRALQPATVSKLVGGWIRDAGLKTMPLDGASAHALRHTAAQDMLDAGHDIRVVQHALGHATVRSTEWYSRCEPPGLRDAMEGRTYGEAA